MRWNNSRIKSAKAFGSLKLSALKVIVQLLERSREAEEYEEDIRTQSQHTHTHTHLQALCSVDYTFDVVADSGEDLDLLPYRTLYFCSTTRPTMARSSIETLRGSSPKKRLDNIVMHLCGAW